MHNFKGEDYIQKVRVQTFPKEDDTVWKGDTLHKKEEGSVV